MINYSFLLIYFNAFWKNLLNLIFQKEKRAIDRRISELEEEVKVNIQKKLFMDHI